MVVSFLRFQGSRWVSGASHRRVVVALVRNGRIFSFGGCRIFFTLNLSILPNVIKHCSLSLTSTHEPLIDVQVKRAHHSLVASARVATPGTGGVTPFAQASLLRVQGSIRDRHLLPNPSIPLPYIHLFLCQKCTLCIYSRVLCVCDVFINWCNTTAGFTFSLDWTISDVRGGILIWLIVINRIRTYYERNVYSGQILYCLKIKLIRGLLYFCLESFYSTIR